MKSNKQSIIKTLNYQNIFFVNEVDRIIITNKISSGYSLDQIYQNSEALQDEIFLQNILNFDNANKSKGIYIFDTGLIDDLAYQEYYCPQYIKENLIENKRYNLAFVLEYPGSHTIDEIRSQDVQTAKLLHSNIINYYSKHNYTIYSLESYNTTNLNENTTKILELIKLSNFFNK